MLSCSFYTPQALGGVTSFFAHECYVTAIANVTVTAMLFFAR